LAKVDYGVAGDFGITDIGARVLPSVFFLFQIENGQINFWSHFILYYLSGYLHGHDHM
jgi:hypothetical protein